MSLSGIYYPHELAYMDSPQSPAAYVSRFDSVETNLNYEMVERRAGGDPTPCFVGAASADPQIRFTTPSIKSILTICTDDNIARDLQAENVRLRYRRGKPQSTREPLGDTKHFTTIMKSSGMMFWETINAREAQDATISARVVTAASNTSSLDYEQPFMTVGQIPIPTATCEELYQLGPVFFNGRQMGSIHEVSWSNNIQLYSRKTGTYPTSPCYQAIDSYAPVCMAKTNDLEEASYFLDLAGQDTLPGSGTTKGLDTYGGQQMTMLQIFLRRRKRTGFYHANSETEHIELRCYGGWKAHVGIDGNPGEATIEFRPSQFTDSSGLVTSIPLIESYIGVAIPDDETVTPVLASANQAATVGTPFTHAVGFAGGGSPTSYSATGLPTGLSIDTNNGLITGTPTGAGTANVTVTGTNSGGSDDVDFDIVVS